MTSYHLKGKNDWVGEHGSMRSIPQRTLTLKDEDCIPRPQPRPSTLPPLPGTVGAEGTLWLVGQLQPKVQKTKGSPSLNCSVFQFS